MSFNQSKNSLNDILKMKRNQDQSENRVSDNQIREIRKVIFYGNIHMKKL